MRALTLTQPWAGLVAAGIKLVENRSRNIIAGRYIGDWIAIHASRESDDAVLDRIMTIRPDLFVDSSFNREWRELARVRGAVIAVAMVDDVVKPAIGESFTEGVFRELADSVEKAMPGQGRWFFGPIGYLLRDVHALPTPVPCRGMLGCWKLPPGVAEKVDEQIARAA